MNENQSNLKNTIMAIVLSLIVVFAWDKFFVPRSNIATQDAQKTDIITPSIITPVTTNSVKDTAIALSENKRQKFSNSEIFGTINLKNGRFDDLTLRKHYNDYKADKKNITLLSPSSTQTGFFAEFAYNIDGKSSSDIGSDWNIISSSDNNIVISKQVGDIKIERNIMLDEHFMFNIKDKIINNSGGVVNVTPYALLNKNYPEGFAKTHSNMAVHSGFIGWLNNKLEEKPFKTIKSDNSFNFKSSGGWIGLTETYWMANIIPSTTDKIIDINVRYNPYAGQDGYQADLVLEAKPVASNSSTEISYKLFAGAKSVDIIEKYRDGGIEGFDYSVDWGWFWFFTKPMFKGLLYLYNLLGNYGLAILALTLVVKLLFYPLANKSYKAMNRMKALQPLMQEIREKNADDPMKQQSEFVELYRREKVNPVAGCWPILLQIPVFYALYKVFNVTLELRHAPFFGWIRDLSMPDVTSFWNLFGLLNYDPSLYIPSFLNIGILPILMGVTMWLQQRMNPQSPDPVQARLMSFFPIVFTFVLGSFASGLVLYWTWNNLLSILQQYIISRNADILDSANSNKKRSK